MISQHKPDLALEQLDRGIMSEGRLGPFLTMLEKALRLNTSAVASSESVAHTSEAADAGVDDSDSSITLVLFGGSTAAGEELGAPEQGFAGQYAAFLQRVLRVPIRLHNLAVGATSSDYYALCGGSHMVAGSDIILAEHALNDLHYAWHTFGRLNDAGATRPADEDTHTGSVLEQVVQQARFRVPNAAFFYAGVIPQARKCWSGEDNPGNAESLAHWGAGYVSTRNLVVGRPPSGPSLWSAWEWGQTVACETLNAPFQWTELFPSLAGHPRAMANVYLALMLARATARALAQLRDLGWVAPHEPPLPVPLHGPGHEPPCLGGSPFACRTTFTPNTGAYLRPLPTACIVSWAERVPVFDAATCGNVWASEAQPSGPVLGWEFTAMDDMRLESADPKLRVRHDVKTYWKSTVLNATARFPVRVGARGQVGIAFFANVNHGEATFVLRCGAAACANSPPMSVNGLGGQRVTYTAVPFRGPLPPGDYVLEVTAWPGHFGIIGVAG